MRIILAALTFALWSSSAAAATTVSEAQEACESALEFVAAPAERNFQETLVIGQCVGVAIGVVQVMVYNCELAPEAVVAKSSDPPSVKHTIEAFVEWADANPSLGNESFADGMMSAIMEAYPCVSG